MSDNPVYKFQRLKLNKSRNSYQWNSIYAKIISPSIFYSKVKIKKVEDREKIKALYLRDATIDIIDISGKSTVIIKSPNKTLILRSKKKDKENGIPSIVELKDDLNLGSLSEEEITEIRNIIENPKNKSFYSYSTPSRTRDRSVSELPRMIDKSDLAKSPRSKTPRGDSKEKTELQKKSQSTPLFRNRSKSLSSKDNKKKIDTEEEPKTPTKPHKIEKSHSLTAEKVKKKRFNFFSLRKKKSKDNKDSFTNLEEENNTDSPKPVENVGTRGRSKSTGKADSKEVIFTHEITKLKDEKEPKKAIEKQESVKEDKKESKVNFTLPKETKTEIETPNKPSVVKGSRDNSSPKAVDERLYNFKVSDDFNESEELQKFISTSPMEFDDLEVSEVLPNVQMDPIFQNDPHRSVKLDELDTMKQILDNMIEGTEIELV